MSSRERALARLDAAMASDDPGDVTVAVAWVDGAGMRVMIEMAGVALHFSPAGARRFAKNFETQAAKAADIAFIGEQLREAAAKVEEVRGGSVH